MKKIWGLLFLLILMTQMTSCGLPLTKHVVKKQGEVRQNTTTDAAFAGMVSSFEQQASAYHGGSFSVGDIPINFGNTENDSFEGVCFIYGNGDREIIIKRTWWDSASLNDRESLLFHELGHCRLDRDHDDEVVRVGNSTFRTSMMNRIIITGRAYSENKNSYLHELFTNDKNLIIDAFSSGN